MGTDFHFKHYDCPYLTDETRGRWGGCKYGKYIKRRIPIPPLEASISLYDGWCERAYDWVQYIYRCPVSQTTGDE